jgi:hypothetical protein
MRSMRWSLTALATRYSASGVVAQIAERPAPEVRDGGIEPCEALGIREKRRRVLSSHAARLPMGYDGAVGAADPMMSASRFAKALIASAKLFSSTVGSWVTA